MIFLIVYPPRYIHDMYMYMLMDMERESRWLPSHTILALLLTD